MEHHEKRSLDITAQATETYGHAEQAHQTQTLMSDKYLVLPGIDMDI